MTKNGCDVEMVDSYQAHVEALNEKGAHIVGTVDFTVPVKAITPEQMEGIYDIVFLFTKQTANDVVLPNLLPHLGPDSTVCTLQNGVPEPFVAGYVGESRTVGGTVLWGATFVGPGESELRRARAQAEAGLVLGGESSLARMRRLGQAELFLPRVMSTDELLERYNAVTREDVLDLARSLMDFSQLSLVSLGRPGSEAEYEKLRLLR